MDEFLILRSCSKAIDALRISVLDLTLGVLVGDIPGKQDTALKLFHPLLQQLYNQGTKFTRRRTLDRAIRFCFHLLEEDPDMTGDDQVQSRNLTLLIHIIVRHPFWDKSGSFTAAQFDLLVDYHLHICGGTDYDLINATFRMLQHGSSNNPTRMRRYIDTIIYFMGNQTTCVSALCAASAIRVEVASMTQDDESLREEFSKALALVVLSDPRQTTLVNNPFKDTSFFVWCRDIPYLQLLCTLAHKPTWHLQLHQSGHLDNCLAIAKILLSQNGGFFQARKYAASVAHIFAIIDALGDGKHPLFKTGQAYPRRPLVLQAWKYIFNTNFFRWPTEDNWITLSREGYLDSLPSLVAYARKQSNNNDDPLIALVEQVCRKIDEEKQRREQGDAEHVYDGSPGCREISALGNQIRALLQYASFTDV